MEDIITTSAPMEMTVVHNISTSCLIHPLVTSLFRAKKIEWRRSERSQTLMAANMLIT